MECGDESTAKLLCCGGNDYHMVKDYLGTLTAFRGVVFSWFKGTTILSCLRCKGNMLREMQAVLLAQMWITAVQMVVVAAVVFFYFAKNSIDSCKNAEMGHCIWDVMTIVMHFAVPLLLVCFGTSVAHFGIVLRPGRFLCLPCCCCCVEGHVALYRGGQESGAL
eukprot:TRINITY_DN18760_c0_g2_i3.p1 TRINITY_DN18760_c0_g2~~TRINITY_DN18760_c0_g2_i3.p1  ORF type:complete len:164 (+),score=32.90 TRINITY_DN18760_c0_g2_i3:133-624(+)